MIDTFGVVGTGVIGAGWAVRALGRGLDVVAWDPALDAGERLKAAVGRAWPSMQKLGLYPGADPGRLKFADSVEEVATASDFIQESAPENEDIKRDLLQRIDAAAPHNRIIASSSSGLLPTLISDSCAHPDRIVIGHPFNPVYLLPLVEIVAGTKTSQKTIDDAKAVYDDLDMHPLVVRNEVPGYLSDRLQEAMWREILHLVNEGIATTGELDEAITYGPGLRWAGFGTNLTFHLAGGERGMRQMLRQFGPALKLPWTMLEAPELTDDLIDAMVEGTREQADGRTIDELERLRDDYLIATLRALRSVNVGAGQILARRESRRYSQHAVLWTPEDEIGTPLELFECAVEPEWVDYNQHMTEAAYLTAFGWATDTLFRYVGDDETYRKSGSTFYTAETHINHLQEALAGDRLRFTTQIVGLDHKRLHFYHEMYNADTGDLLATTEQMDLHVDQNEGKTAPIHGAARTSARRDLAGPPDHASTKKSGSSNEHSEMSIQYLVLSTQYSVLSTQYPGIRPGGCAGTSGSVTQMPVATKWLSSPTDKESRERMGQ